jgi:hypothetical protein
MQSDKNNVDFNEIKVIKPKVPIKTRINNGIGNYYTTHYDTPYDKSMQYHFGLESNQDIRFQFSVKDKFEQEKNYRNKKDNNMKVEHSINHDTKIQPVLHSSIDQHIHNASPTQKRYDIKLSKEQLLQIRYNKNLNNYEKTKMILGNISLNEIDPYNLLDNYPELTLGSLASKYIIFKRINDPRKGGGNDYNYKLIINTLKYIVKIMSDTS